MNWQVELAAWLPWVPAFLLSISVHESAHAWAALKLGDSTAAERGRISLYPPKHIEFFGTILLPVLSLVLTQMQFIYGYAKPTPVNPGKLRKPKAHFSLVAAAGPLSNLALALVSILVLKLMMPYMAPENPMLGVVRDSAVVNLILGILNLFPLPGFDGMKMLYVFLPNTWCWWISHSERWMLFLVIIASFWGAFDWVGTGFDAVRFFLSRWAGVPL